MYSKRFVIICDLSFFLCESRFVNSLQPPLRGMCLWSIRGLVIKTGIHRCTKHALRCLCVSYKATNIFFEKVCLFGWDCEHVWYCCRNCVQRTKFCQFLHEHKGNIVQSLDSFLHLNLCLRTAHQITVIQIIFTKCLHQPQLVVCLQKLIYCMPRTPMLPDTNFYRG